MARVLVVDADPAIRATLTSALASDHHDVESVSSGASGLAITRGSRPDIVIVELDLPELAGLELIREIRRDPAATGAPLLIVLTSITRESDRVAAFEAGADDYVTKPHSTRELLLRVRALARRRSEPPKADHVRLGRLEISVGARKVAIDSRPVDLTLREFDLLLTLAQRAGRVQTREVLVADVWGDVEHSARIVDTTVKRLRRKIATAGCEIETVRGVGYRLVTGSG